MERRVKMKRIILYGRKVVGGYAEGEAIVTRDTISGWGGMNPLEGTIIERRHELRDQSFKGKVLVFPAAKGSSGWSNAFHVTRLAGTAPKALIIKHITSKSALGAVVMHIPTVTDLNQNPLDVITNGDWVKINADNGTIEVIKQKN